MYSGTDTLEYHGFFAFFDIDPIPRTKWDAVCMHVYKYRTNKNGHEQQKKRIQKHT